MKSLLFSVVLGASALELRAATFSYSSGDLADLDHHDATKWGMNFTLPAGHQISSATITIKNIGDWRQEQDILFIRLLDDTRLGVCYIEDNTFDNVFADFFSGQGTFLTSWSDPEGGCARNFDLVYKFTPENIAALTSYFTDPTESGLATFGLGFDPDCHYWN